MNVTRCKNYSSHQALLTLRCLRLAGVVVVFRQHSICCFLSLNIVQADSVVGISLCHTENKTLQKMFHVSEDVDVCVRC